MIVLSLAYFIDILPVLHDLCKDYATNENRVHVEGQKKISSNLLPFSKSFHEIVATDIFSLSNLTLSFDTRSLQTARVFKKIPCTVLGQ